MAILGSLSEFDVAIATTDAPSLSAQTAKPRSYQIWGRATLVLGLVLTGAWVALLGHIFFSAFDPVFVSLIERII